MKSFNLTFLVLFALFLWGCGNGNTTPSSSFDRSKLLENMANNLIKPNFANLKTKTDGMDAAIRLFATESNAANLAAAQTAWEEAYTAWQHCNAFNFGPADLDVFGELSKVVATFPAEVPAIESKISSNQVSMDNFEFKQRGFLAIDYLLFDLNGNTAVLPKYATNATNVAARKQYLQNVSADIKSKVDIAVAGWTDKFTKEFIANNGTDVGSSTSQLYNNFIASYENAKNFKVSLPAGKRVGQTMPEPTRVEGYYSGKSVKFLKEQLKAIDNIWAGRAMNGQDGLGFEEYLNSVVGGSVLVSNSKTQFTAVQQAANALPETPLSATINTNLAVVEKLAVEMQKQTRFFKSDMSSLLGIAITFNSGDGD